MSLLRKRRPISEFDDPQLLATRTHANLIIGGILLVLVGFFAKIVFL